MQTSRPETHEDKAESEQGRKVLGWDGDSCNWPEALGKDELLITASQGSIMSVTPGVCISDHIHICGS